MLNGANAHPKRELPGTNGRTVSHTGFDAPSRESIIVDNDDG
jgi:hypothetical protein